MRRFGSCTGENVRYVTDVRANALGYQYLAQNLEVQSMATRSMAFRLNDKNREDKEIMDWLDKVVYEGEYYDSLVMWLSLP